MKLPLSSTGHSLFVVVLEAVVVRSVMAVVAVVVVVAMVVVVVVVVVDVVVAMVVVVVVAMVVVVVVVAVVEVVAVVAVVAVVVEGQGLLAPRNVQVLHTFASQSAFSCWMNPGSPAHEQSRF
jgi:hypothetical protein